MKNCSLFNESFTYNSLINEDNISENYIKYFFNHFDFLYKLYNLYINSHIF